MLHSSALERIEVDPDAEGAAAIGAVCNSAPQLERIEVDLDPVGVRAAEAMEVGGKGDGARAREGDDEMGTLAPRGSAAALGAKEPSTASVLLSVVIPEGCTPGGMFKVTLPTGKSLFVTAPRGSYAGETLSIRVPEERSGGTSRPAVVGAAIRGDRPPTRGGSRRIRTSL